MAKSTVSISFEKRLTIRPSGVVSKKLIGLRRTLYNRAACNFFALRRLPNANKNDDMRIATA